MCARYVACPMFCTSASVSVAQGYLAFGAGGGPTFGFNFAKLF
jgi:hypothetical protein